MRLTRTCVFVVFAFCLFFAVAKNHAADVRSGDWTIHHSDDPGKVEFSLIAHSHGENSNHESDWPMTSFPGVDFSKRGDKTVALGRNRRDETRRARLIAQCPT